VYRVVDIVVIGLTVAVVPVVFVDNLLCTVEKGLSFFSENFVVNDVPVNLGPLSLDLRPITGREPLASKSESFIQQKP